VPIDVLVVDLVALAAVGWVIWYFWIRGRSG